MICTAESSPSQRWVQDDLPALYHDQHTRASSKLSKQTEVWRRTNGGQNQLWRWPHDQNEQIICNPTVSTFQTTKQIISIIFMILYWTITKFPNDVVWDRQIGEHEKSEQNLLE